jgi:hypothetical protein
VSPSAMRARDFVLKEMVPLEQMSQVLIRDEYRRLLDLLEKRDKGAAGSAWITGQPGIGTFPLGLFERSILLT